MHRTLNREAAKAIREAKGISLRQLARDIHRDHGHISRVERGTHQASLPTLIAIADRLEVPLDAITFVTDDGEDVAA